MTAISANDTALRKHISTQKELAYRLLGVMKGLEALDMSLTAPDAVTVLIEIAKKMADDLYMNLDSSTIASNP